MATGVELASAYISLSVETSKVAKQVQSAFDGTEKHALTAGSRTGSAFSTGFTNAASKGSRGAGSALADNFEREAHPRAARAGERVGSVIGKAMGGAINIGIKGAAIAATGAIGALGYTLTKGFQRLEKIDQAKFKLKALGNSAEDVDKIMQSATDAVKGTAFALDEATNAAASATAAGIKPGKQMTEYLQNIADTAAIAGVSFDDMASIFNKVQANGKAYTDDLQQLQDRGVPVMQYLQKQYGVTADEFRKMVEDGKVSSADFNAALDKNLGGAAQKMGQSFSGAVDNMQTAVARLGANFLSAIFGGPNGDALKAPADAINLITVKLDEAGRWVTAHSGEIKAFFTDAADTAKALADGVGSVVGFLDDMNIGIGDVVIAFAAWKTIAGVSSLIGQLGTISTMLGKGGKGGKGGSGILGQIGALSLATGVMGGGDDPLSTLSTIGGGALLGFQLGGPYGAAAGTVLGAGAATWNGIGTEQDRLAAEAERFNSQWGPTVPGAPGSTTAVMPPNGAGSYSPSSNPFAGPYSAQRPLDAILGGNTGTGGMGPGGKPMPGTGLPPGMAQSYGLPKGSNSGGYGGGGVKFPDWVYQLGAKFGVKPSTYPGHQEGSGQNRGIDWTGPVENMQRFAEYMASGIPGVEQVIWDNPGTGQKIGSADGQRVGPGTSQPGYYQNDWGGHRDHVHTRIAMPVMGFDSGGWLPPGQTMAVNKTGKPELILTPEQIQAMMDQGVDPNTLLHGGAQGAPPGPVGDPTTEQGTVRTEGYIPAAAGSTGVAGTSSLSALFNLGNEAVAGAIDVGADLAKMGASAGIAAGTMGAGAAAGPAASMGIDVLAGIAKRGASYGFQMASIGADALIEQFFPFGAPRWLGYDYTGFAPQLGISPAAVTTAEQAIQMGAPQPGVDPNTTQHGQAQGAPPGPLPPVQPGQFPGTNAPGTPEPDPMAKNPVAENPAPPNDPFGTNAAPAGPGAAPSPGAAPPTGGVDPTDPMSWLSKLGLFDNGGMLQHGQAGLNLSGQPEAVLTGQQWQAVKAAAIPDADPTYGMGSLVNYENVTVKDEDEFFRRQKADASLAMMRYGGRP